MVGVPHRPLVPSLPTVDFGANLVVQCWWNAAGAARMTKRVTRPREPAAWPGSVTRQSARAREIVTDPKEPPSLAKALTFTPCQNRKDSHPHPSTSLRAPALPRWDI